MQKNDRKSAEDRKNIYVEIGKHFSPDGSFDETEFRDSIETALSKIKNEGNGGENITKKISTWLSAYLTTILDYLESKEMFDASFKLFKTALEVSGKFGVEALEVPANHLKNILSKATLQEKISANEKKPKSAKKEKIFDAAMQVFTSKGYHGATIDEIASLSGVGKGSVYRYFKSKEDILEQLLQDKYEDIMNRMNRIFAEEGTVLDHIQKMIKLWVGFIEDNPVSYRLIQNVSVGQENEGRQMFYDYFINHLPMFKERIVSLNQENKIKTTNFYTVIYGILGFIDGVAYKWFRKSMDYSLRDEIPVILEVLFNGFVGEKNKGKAFFYPDSD